MVTRILQAIALILFKTLYLIHFQIKILLEETYFLASARQCLIRLQINLRMILNLFDLLEYKINAKAVFQAVINIVFLNKIWCQMVLAARLNLKCPLYSHFSFLVQAVIKVQCAQMFLTTLRNWKNILVFVLVIKHLKSYVVIKLLILGRIHNKIF